VIDAKQADSTSPYDAAWGSLTVTMERRANIDRDLDRALHDVELSSRSSSKFDRARALLEERWGIQGLVIKALGAPKNYGNRISESSGTGASALLLIAEEDLDLDAVHRAYLGRATSLVPTLVVQRTSLGIVPRLVLAEGANPFPWDSVVVTVEPREPIAETSIDAAGAVRELLAIDGITPAQAGVDRLQAAAAAEGLHVKQVSDAKNLKNRVREALGHRPAILVVIVDKHLEERARIYLSTLHRSIPHMLLAVRGESLRISRVSPSAHSQNTTSFEYAMPEIEPDIAADGELSYQVNRTVTELGHYLPFDAAAGNLYEEHINVQQRLEFDTAALAFIRQLISDARVSMVVFTGNAGHGKTHLCRRLLSSTDADPRAIMKSMSADAMGKTLVEIPEASRGVRIIKDLSELSPEAAAARLEELLEDTESLAIVCANEGRLRHVVSLRPSLRILVDTLEAGIRDGATAVEDEVHVVNLNYQAVTPHSREAFLDFALDHWLSNGNRWRKCQQCLAADACPIRANRAELSMSPEVRKANRPVRDALSHLVRLAEQSGYVLTIREGLIFVAFLITGGLGCEDVHRLHRRGKVDGFKFLDSLFSRELAPNELAQLRILERIRRFDPGKTAIRSIDERLHRELEGSGHLGEAVLEVGSRPPSTRDQLRREQTEHRKRLRQARRQDYFSPSKRESDISHSRRLGLVHHEDFLALQSQSIPDSRMLEILERLVAGLHVVQGIRVTGEGSGVLFLVDPAFSRSSNRSAVIAFQFDQQALELVGEAQYWKETEGEPSLLQAVDWLDRRVVLAFRADEGARPTLVLDFDLLQFEFVMRSATGIVFEEFNAAERMRIVSRLAKLAEENRQMTRDIKVMEGGTLRRLILERDNSFRVATVG
jgi:hypothetical protein